jgi:hypothetical protein
MIIKKNGEPLLQGRSAVHILHIENFWFFIHIFSFSKRNISCFFQKCTFFEEKYVFTIRMFIFDVVTGALLATPANAQHPSL